MAVSGGMKSATARWASSDSESDFLGYLPFTFSQAFIAGPNGQNEVFSRIRISRIFVPIDYVMQPFSLSASWYHADFFGLRFFSFCCFIHRTHVCSFCCCNLHFFVGLFWSFKGSLIFALLQKPFFTLSRRKEKGPPSHGWREFGHAALPGGEERHPSPILLLHRRWRVLPAYAALKCKTTTCTHW